MLSTVWSVCTGRGTQLGLVVRLLAKWRRDSEELRGRQAASTCASRPASQPGKITQRLELTSLSLANHLVTSTHPIQWELCLGEGYQVWPHIHSLLFLPTSTAFSQILTTSCLWCWLLLTGSISISSLNKYNSDVWSHGGFYWTGSKMLFTKKQLTFLWVIVPCNSLHTSDVKTPRDKHTQALVFCLIAVFF